MRGQRVIASLLAIGLGSLGGPSGCKKADDIKARPSPIATASSSSQGGGGGGVGGGGSAGGGGFGGKSSAGGGGAGGKAAEDCYDGIDGDEDGFVDCLDHDPDCTKLGICTNDQGTGNSCADTKTIADPTTALLGDNTEHAVLPGVSCETTQPGLAGYANVYHVTAASDGILDALAAPVQNANDLVLSARSKCGDPKTELACGEGLGDECVHLAVKKGDEIFLAVAGYSALTYGPFHLTVKTRPKKCGDGLIDPGENCDDGNAIAGDGCSDTCTMEVGEVEPNGTVATANPFKEPMLGAISPAGDVDVISFDVAKANSKIVVTTKPIPGNDCVKRITDSFLDLIDQDGVTVLKSDDDSNGVTAQITYLGLSIGKYYLRLKAAPGAPPKHVFSYRWSLKLTP